MTTASAYPDSPKTPDPNSNRTALAKMLAQTQPYRTNQEYLAGTGLHP